MSSHTTTVLFKKMSDQKKFSGESPNSSDKRSESRRYDNFADDRVSFLKKIT